MEYPDGFIPGSVLIFQGRTGHLLRCFPSRNTSETPPHQGIFQGASLSRAQRTRAALRVTARSQLQKSLGGEYGAAQGRPQERTGSGRTHTTSGALLLLLPAPVSRWDDAHGGAPARGGTQLVAPRARNQSDTADLAGGDGQQRATAG